MSPLTIASSIHPFSPTPSFLLLPFQTNTNLRIFLPALYSPPAACLLLYAFFSFSNSTLLFLLCFLHLYLLYLYPSSPSSSFFCTPFFLLPIYASYSLFSLASSSCPSPFVSLPFPTLNPFFHLLFSSLCFPSLPYPPASHPSKPPPLLLPVPSCSSLTPVLAFHLSFSSLRFPSLSYPPASHSPKPACVEVVLGASRDLCGVIYLVLAVGRSAYTMRK